MRDEVGGLDSAEGRIAGCVGRWPQCFPANYGWIAVENTRVFGCSALSVMPFCVTVCEHLIRAGSNQPDPIIIPARPCVLPVATRRALCD